MSWGYWSVCEGSIRQPVDGPLLNALCQSHKVKAWLDVNVHVQSMLAYRGHGLLLTMNDLAGQIHDFDDQRARLPRVPHKSKLAVSRWIGLHNRQRHGGMSDFLQSGYVWAAWQCGD